MPASAITQNSPSSSWNPVLQSPHLLEMSTTPAGLPSSSLAPTPSPFMKGSYRHSDKTPSLSKNSPSYFSVILDSPRIPPDSNPGPYAKRNWESQSSFMSSECSSKSSVSPAAFHADCRENRGSDDSVLREIAQIARRHQTDAVSKSIPPHSLSQGQTHLSRRHTSFNLNGEHSTDSSSVVGDTPQHQSTSPVRSFTWFPSTASLPSDCPSLPRHQETLDTTLSPNSGLTWFIGTAKCRTPLLPQLHSGGTLPAFPKHDGMVMVSPEECAELLGATTADVLLLDVRPYPQFSQGNITGSLNLCIPTTLLKRPSFNTQKLQDTFVDELERREFASWPNKTHIIVYDAGAQSPRDSVPLVNMLKKFTSEGWKGQALILRGGFANFATGFPNHVRYAQTVAKRDTTGDQSRLRNLHVCSVAPIVGGCMLPASAATEPFFGNIRQNMDLVGGVGQIPIKPPESLTEDKRQRLPNWLRVVSDSQDQGHLVSERFLNIERRELERMKEALSVVDAHSVHTEPLACPRLFRVAGLEQGSKNRYNDIYPFDHSRVRLVDIAGGDSDYINANHIKAEYTNRSYIATQAPVPDTFCDFWRVVWEQNVSVIVALTAEVEHGQVKCHCYWKTGQYGPFQIKELVQKKVPIGRPSPHSRSKSQHHPADSPDFSKNPDLDTLSPNVSVDLEESPCILIRHFTISHSAFPFQPLREVTQLQFSYWPDFGTSQPTHILRLIEQCNKLARANSSTHFGCHEPEPEGQRPILVHCSAGCGRTGTFCTIDSVIDMLKRVSLTRSKSRSIDHEAKDVFPGDQPVPVWIEDEHVDLVAKTVEDFRTQRPSMVQNLRQFVLCYESILEWVTSGPRRVLLSEEE